MAYGFGRGDNCRGACCQQKPGRFHEIIKLVDGGRYALAFTPFIFAQYQNTFDTQDFRQLWTLWMASGKVRELSTKDSKKIRRRLFSLGFPTSDYAYIIAAGQTKRQFIITEDVDFWDPRLKRQNHSAKEHAKNRDRGAVLNELRTNGITVKNIVNAYNSLS